MNNPFIGEEEASLSGGEINSPSRQEEQLRGGDRLQAERKSWYPITLLMLSGYIMIKLW